MYIPIAANRMNSFTSECLPSRGFEGCMCKMVGDFQDCFAEAYRDENFT